MAYHLVDNKDDCHEAEVLSLTLLTENCFQVTLKQFHNEYVVIAFFSEPVNLGDSL